MDLALTFKEGVVTGSGNDPVGPFVIQGKYEAQKNEIWWTKTYIGRHDVFYKGFRDTRGIWGTWEIQSWWRGGFHIWPKGQGGGLSQHAEVEVDAPQDAVSVGEGRGPVDPKRDPKSFLQR